MSVYIYSGKDLYRQETQLKNLLKQWEITSENLEMIDASDRRTFRMEEAMMRCDSFSLFSDGEKKAVIVKDPFFLNASIKDTEAVKKTDSPAVKKRKEKELAVRDQRMDILEQYLRRPNPETLLVFYCHGFDADSRKKEYKLLTQFKAEVVEFKQMNDRDFENYADQEIKKSGFTLDRQARQELLDRVDKDTLLLHNAIIKMDLYGKKKLNLNDVQHIVPMNANVNVFRMSAMFVNGNLGGALKAKDEMMNAGYDANALISMLGSRLRALYAYKHLREQGMSEETIATRMHANKWAVKFGLQDCSELSSRTLLKYLNELAELDQGIKTGKVEAKAGFEQYLIRNSNR